MTFDHGGYFLFLFFVFMMTIVFMNLLNGLAVSDTQAIKNEAELVTFASRVKLLHHFERSVRRSRPLPLRVQTGWPIAIPLVRLAREIAEQNKRIS
jgi:hypothetical protein